MTMKRAAGALVAAVLLGACTGAETEPTPVAAVQQPPATVIGATPAGLTPYGCPEYYALNVTCGLDPNDGRWVVSASSGGTTTTSIYQPECRIFLHSDGVTSHRCSTPSTDESRANRVTWTPIECPADLPPTETDCHMGSNGELRSRSTVGTDLAPPANRYIPPS
jgi:hypothetical protein